MEIAPDSRPTHHLLNSGLVVLKPSQSVMNEMEWRIQNDAVIETYRFPDQDFLAEYFHGRFVPLPYVYNALKKLRTSHPKLWRDDEAKNVHVSNALGGRLQSCFCSLTHLSLTTVYHQQALDRAVEAG